MAVAKTMKDVYGWVPSRTPWSNHLWASFPPSRRRTTHHLQPVLPHGFLSSDAGSRRGIYVSFTVDGTLHSSWFVSGWGVMGGHSCGPEEWCPLVCYPGL